MDKRVQKLIVDALRSGHYKQTTGICKDFNGCFCFNGVVLDVYRLDTGDGKWSEGSLIHNDGNDSDACFSPQVLKWLFPELDITHAGVIVDEFNNSYWKLNDHEYPFHELADMVEKGYVKVR